MCSLYGHINASKMTMMIMTMEDYDEVIFKLFELFITSSSLLEIEAMKGRREYVDEVRIYEEKIQVSYMMYGTIQIYVIFCIT